MARPPDKSASCAACVQCGEGFSLFNWRHWCRNCGRGFCKSCSSYSMPIPKYNYARSVRMCGDCYVTICGETGNIAGLKFLPVQILRKHLQKLKINDAYCVEKDDLTNKIQEYYASSSNTPEVNQDPPATPARSSRSSSPSINNTGDTNQNGNSPSDHTGNSEQVNRRNPSTHLHATTPIISTEPTTATSNGVPATNTATHTSTNPQHEELGGDSLHEPPSIPGTESNSPNANHIPSPSIEPISPNENHVPTPPPVPTSPFVDIEITLPESVQTHIDGLPIRELKRILRENNIGSSGCVEKQDLILRVKQFVSSLTQQERDKLFHDPQIKKEEVKEAVESGDVCKICFENVINCVILECGHLVVCLTCGRMLSHCPICRQRISRLVHTFRA